MSAPVDLAVVGAGMRGARAYGAAALDHPDEVRFRAVVEPHPERRARFAAAHGIGPEAQFGLVEELVASRPPVEAVLVATPDDAHEAPTITLMEAGYDVLVEKPLAPTAAACVAMVRAAERTGRDLQVCHVLRFTAFFRRLHEIVAGGALGEIVSVEHRENIGFWHMAHSYVRGAYADTSVAAPLVIAKCCHDLDIVHWNVDDPCVRVGSAGSLRQFRPERAPAGAPARCTDGCPAEEECAFSAPFVYLGEPDASRPGGWRPVTPFSWMPLTDHGQFDPATGMLTETAEERLAALRHGRYGRCVYHCDNDALDTQVVTMELASGATALLAISGHAEDDYRTVRYDGSRASVTGYFGDVRGAELTLHDHRSGRSENVPLDRAHGLHGGGDVGLIRAYAAARRGQSGNRADARDALAGHLVGLAAEEARVCHSVVDVDDFSARAGWSGSSGRSERQGGN